MAVQIEREVKLSELEGAERELIEAIRAAVERAMVANVDPNHILSILSGVFVKSAVVMGLPVDKLEDLIEGVRLTIESERSNREKIN